MHDDFITILLVLIITYNFYYYHDDFIIILLVLIITHNFYYYKSSHIYFITSDHRT